MIAATGAIANREAHSWAVFVELNARQDVGYMVSLEWDRDTGETQIVVADRGTGSLLMFLVPGECAGDAFRHPFGYVA